MDHSRAIEDSLIKHIEDKISVNLSWTRPANVPYPNIWKRLEVKSKNGEAFKVRIKDVIPNRYEEVLDFMNSNFDCQEPVSKSIDISSDSESIAARRAVRIKILDQRLSLIATLEDEQNDERNGRIMGALLLIVESKNDTPLKVVGEKWTILRNFFSDILKKGIDPFQLLNSDCFFSDYGVGPVTHYS